MVDIVGDTPTDTESDIPTVTHPDTPTFTKSNHILSKFNEPEAFVTQGMVNNIAIAIILDSGAKRSVVSQDFIAHDSHPVGIETICGISQTPSMVQVHDVSVAMTGLNGTCRVAVETSLPPKTVLLGTDLGTDKLLELLNDIKTKPTTVFSITRSMAAQDAAADRITLALHASEGANPLPLESLPDIQEEVEHSVTQNKVVHSDTDSVVTHTTSPASHVVDTSSSQLYVSLPNFSFDGITRDKFVQLQKEDISLKPLWEQASKGDEAYFINNNILMSITSTLNHHSHALLVPAPLRRSVLIAAHDGLGHGGIGATRALINKHFTWPSLKKDITDYIDACNTCKLNNRGGGTKLPLCEPQVITERFEKLAVDVVGPLPTTKRHYRYILTCIDLATSFPIAIPMRTYTAAETAQALLSIISCFGSPLAILSDQSANFLSTTLIAISKSEYCQNHHKSIQATVQWNFRTVSCNIKGYVKEIIGQSAARLAHSTRFGVFC